MSRGKRGRKPRHESESWTGYMNAKKAKLEDQFETGEDREVDGIFSGISIYVNGYTDPTAHELKNIMLNNGGKYHHYYSHSKTTHVIASNLPNSKIANIKGKLIVDPKWIVDSLEAQKLLDHSKYLLYVKPPVGQTVINFVPQKPLNATEVKASSSMSTANDNFISEFYNNSRLHHISTMGAFFKEYVRKLQASNEEREGLRKYKDWLLNNRIKKEFSPYSRIIMHADMDCFFVSVGIRKRPHLRGKPVAVTHSKGNRVSHVEGMNRQAEFDLYRSKKRKDKNSFDEDSHGEVEGVRIKQNDSCLIDETSSMSEIASCSYEARSVGIKNGMFVGSALKLCPHLEVIPYDFEGYKEVALTFYNCISSITKNIESVSCDELYIDCTEVLNETQSEPADLAWFIKESVFSSTQCHCSIGIGPNLLISRMATNKAKPNGVFSVDESQCHSFMLNQKVSSLPGVGHNLNQNLERHSIHICADLQKWSSDKLQHNFGAKTGLSLYQYSRGIDQRSLNTEHERKSVSAEVNFGIRFKDFSDAESFLEKLSEEVSSRLKSIALMGKLLTLKLKVRAEGAPKETAKFMGHGFCDNVTRSTPLPCLTSDSSIICKESLSLLRKIKVDPTELRGVGIQLSKLEEATVSTRSIRNFMKPKKEVKINEEEAPQEDNTLDKSVLDALPESMRAEVIAEYKAKGFKIPGVVESQPGPSKVTKSGLNESFLEALPDDIRLEVQQNFQQLTRPVKSPRKISPKKRRKQMVIDSKQTKLTSGGTIMKKSPVKSVCDNIDTSLPSSKLNSVEDIPNFCGESDLKEIRKMIVEWIQSCQSPQVEDIVEITTYCRKLMKSKDLETLDLLIKFLKRKLEGLDTWTQTFDAIVTSVQHDMIEIYGSELLI